MMWPLMLLLAAPGDCGPEKVSFDRVDCSTLFADATYDEDGDGSVDGDVEVLREGRARWVVELRCDNCPHDFNPDQRDSNGNGIGDACEGGGPEAWRGGGGCECVRSDGVPPWGSSLLTALAVIFASRRRRSR